MKTFVLCTFSGEMFLKDIDEINCFPEMTYTKKEAKKFRSENPNKYAIHFVSRYNLKIKLYPCSI